MTARFRPVEDNPPAGSSDDRPVADLLGDLGFVLAGGAGQTAWIDRP